MSRSLLIAGLSVGLGRCEACRAPGAFYYPCEAQMPWWGEGVWICDSCQMPDVPHARMVAERQAYRATTCRHVYVTSDGQCMHCNADVSREMAAAFDRLNAHIARSSASGPHSPSNSHSNTGRGVTISTHPGPAPRHGGLVSLRTTSPHGGV